MLDKWGPLVDGLDVSQSQLGHRDEPTPRQAPL